MAYIKAECNEKGNASVEVDGSGVELLALLTAIVDGMKGADIPAVYVMAAVAMGIKGTEAIKREENE